jgi:hypothetical protein
LQGGGEGVCVRGRALCNRQRSGASGHAVCCAHRAAAPGALSNTLQRREVRGSTEGATPVNAAGPPRWRRPWSQPAQLRQPRPASVRSSPGPAAAAHRGTTGCPPPGPPAFPARGHDPAPAVRNREHGSGRGGGSSGVGEGWGGGHPRGRFKNQRGCHIRTHPLGARPCAAHSRSNRKHAHTAVWCSPLCCGLAALAMRDGRCGMLGGGGGRVRTS